MYFFTLIEFFVKLITGQMDPEDELDFLKHGVSGGVDGLRKSFLLPRRIIAKVCAKTAHHHSYHTLASECCWRKRTLLSVSRAAMHAKVVFTNFQII